PEVQVAADGAEGYGAERIVALAAQVGHAAADRASDEAERIAQYAQVGVAHVGVDRAAHGDVLQVDRVGVVAAKVVQVAADGVAVLAVEYDRAEDVLFRGEVEVPADDDRGNGVEKDEGVHAPQVEVAAHDEPVGQ